MGGPCTRGRILRRCIYRLLGTILWWVGVGPVGVGFFFMRWDDGLFVVEADAVVGELGEYFA